MATPTQLLLYDSVGEWGKNAKAFMDEIEAAGNNPIELRINSLGGAVFDGFAIFNALQRHAAGVTVYIDGIAASIASYIAMAGKEIFMAPNAMFMIHNPSGGMAETADDHRKQAEILDQLRNSMVAAYSDRTGIPQDEITKMIDEETWLDANQALAFGFVDGISEPLAMAAEAKLDPDQLKKFKHAPKNIMETKEKTTTDNTDKKISPPDPSEKSVVKNAPSVFARVSGWIKDNAQLVTEIADLRGQVESKERETCDYVNQITAQKAVIERLESEVTQFKAAATELEQALTAATTTATAEKQSRELIEDFAKKSGIDVKGIDKTEAVTEARQGKSAEELIAQYESLVGAEKTIFFREHTKELRKAYTAAATPRAA